jgi:hypothetical protein
VLFNDIALYSLHVALNIDENCFKLVAMNIDENCFKLVALNIDENCF